MVARQEAREVAKSSGGARRSSQPKPEVDSMRASSSITKSREEARKRLAETQKQDAD
jgi:hypothetical protein